MSKSIIVGSMNIQNKYRIKNYDGRDKGRDNSLILKHFLDEYNIDVLGTQELVRRFINRIKVVITPEYNIYGSFRYGNTALAKNVPIVDKFNETVSVITKHRVLYSKTTKLPWIPRKLTDILKGIERKSMRPRITTSCVIQIKDFGTINFINTHLDHRLNIIQIRQMNYLLKQVEKSKYPVILTGDFNMDMNMPRFKNFVANLEALGYKRVPNKEKTYKHQIDKLPIDHIFIPKKWNIDAMDIIKDDDLKYFSDHYPILVKISK